MTHYPPVALACLHMAVLMTTFLGCRYVILPKDFEKGYKANVKKSDADFDFYR